MMLNHQEYEHIPASEFEFVPMEGRMHDKKLETKPVGYFKDAMQRFVRNKSSVVAACIICVLFLYAIFVPVFCQTKYTLSPTDTMYLNYAKLPPKLPGMGWLGMDGTAVQTLNEANYNAMRAIGVETGYDPIVEVLNGPYTDGTSGKKTQFYDVRVDKYYAMGMMSLTLTPDQYEDIQKWQDENGIQVLFPINKDAKQADANVWYEADKKGTPKLTKKGEFKANYKTTAATDTSYHSLRIAADNDPEKPMSYGRVTGTSNSKSYVCRVCKYTYFQYRYGMEPQFAFGTDSKGTDILTRLASGARFSFVLAIVISAINMLIGTIYGAIEGYYGGTADLVMERISDILAGVPFIVVTSLFQLHLAKQAGPIVALLLAFVATGWIGMASSVRMQFYRFKGQEYVLAARTLGANDRRIMFKHIFPNSLGTLITGAVMVIPGVIFSESSLTYLGIINLESTTMTSVGTMLANGKSYLATDPFIIFFPALFISLLEISFNLFGNGLRDAFNPSLRGAE